MNVAVGKCMEPRSQGQAGLTGLSSEVWRQAQPLENVARHVLQLCRQQPLIAILSKIHACVWDRATVRLPWGCRL